MRKQFFCLKKNDVHHFSILANILAANYTYYYVFLLFKIRDISKLIANINRIIRINHDFLFNLQNLKIIAHFVTPIIVCVNVLTYFQCSDINK